jgi:hypothetical protein
MIHLLYRLLPTDTINGFFQKKNLSLDLGLSDPDPSLGVVAIAVEPKEGVEEGGRAAGWVVAEVVRAAGWVASPGAPNLGHAPRLGAVAITA